MKLKGLVWFFAIALILISVWELSYTFVVRSYESKIEAQAKRTVKSEYPNVTGDQLDLLIKAKKQHLLDSTRDKVIYMGTTYQKCKENELNLGLDLQGGMSVTMNVSLEGLLKSLSNNPKDPQLLKAIQTATAEKQSNVGEDYITLFRDAYTQQNPGVKLSTVFAGPGKEIKVADDDDKVTTELQTIAKGAIDQTYKILLKRIDKFGVAQPNINLDENKGIINVELAGVSDKERVRKLLQSSANLQFWEVYNLQELEDPLTNADKVLSDYLAGATKDSVTNKTTVDSTKLNATKNAFLRIINPIQPQQDPKTGKEIFAANIGAIALKDTGTFNSYINMDIVKNAFPENCKFLLGTEQTSAKDGMHFYELYAIKTVPGSDKAKLEGDGVDDAYQSYDDRGQPSIKMEMTNVGAKTWAKITADNAPVGDNPGRPIAIVLDDVVYTTPMKYSRSILQCYNK